MTHEFNLSDNSRVIYIYERTCRIHNPSSSSHSRCSRRADILQMEEANTRQLVSRARKHIADGRRTPVSSGEQRRLLEAFIAAAQKGDMAALEGLFAEDVVSRSDGGGIVRATRVPVSGRKCVATFIAAASHSWKGVTLAWVETNGQAAILINSRKRNGNATRETHVIQGEKDFNCPKPLVPLVTTNGSNSKPEKVSLSVD